MEYKHIPVMLDEVLKYLQLKEGDNVVDGTLGGAGYTTAIAEKIGPNGRVFSFDMDKLAIENAEKIIKKQKLDNITLINDNFRNLRKNLKKYTEEEGFQGFSQFVFDLGLSSAQLEDRTRGFSFQLDAPLDMAFGHVITNMQGKTFYIVNKYSQNNLKKIIKEYGEERYAGNIARKIKEERKLNRIETTKHLVEVISKAVPKSYKNNKKIHFATKTFQALRIETNGEIENIKKALPDALSLLKKGGRIAVVSFHSLEDRIVKQFFKTEARDCLCPREVPICQCGHTAQLKIISKKIIQPSEEEIAKNPRARSAKMRVAEKITSCKNFFSHDS